MKVLLYLITAILLIYLPKVSKGIEKNIFKFELKQISSKKVYLYFENSFGKEIIDSSEIVDSKFEIKINNTIENKFIYLSFNSNLTDPIVLINDEPNKLITISSSYINFIDSINILNSEINSQFYNCLKIQKVSAVRLRFLFNLLNQIPKTDKLHNLIKNEYLESKKKFHKESEKCYKYFNSNKQYNYAFQYLKFQQNLILNSTEFDSSYKTTTSIQFDIINNNPELINTELVELLFNNVLIEAAKSGINEDEYFVNVFKEVKNLFYNNIKNPIFQTKFTYHYINFLNHLKKYELITAFFIEFPTLNYIKGKFNSIYLGDKIEDIYGIDSIGNLVSIKDSRSTNKIIIIWSEECEHCADLIAQINRYIDKVENNENTIFSFCIQNYFKRNNHLKLNWKNQLYLVNGWSNVFIKKYNIEYTPFIIILDKNNRIIGLPNPENIFKILENL